MESCLKLIQRKSYNKFGVICLYTQSAYNLPLYTIWCNLPLHNLLIINFGIVLLLSIIYAYSVKHRVEIFANPLSSTPIDAKDQSQPLSAILQAATDPLAHQNSIRYSVFTLYVTHLILCRIIPLILFAARLSNSSNFPVQFHCQ